MITNFKDCLDKLRAAIGYAPIQAARVYVPMLERFHEELLKRSRKTIEEQAVQLGKLKTEAEQAWTEWHRSKEAHLSTREAFDRLREANHTEKQQKVAEWYGSGGVFGDVKFISPCRLVFTNPLSKPSTKTPSHEWRANPNKKWETSYTKRVAGWLQDILDSRIKGRKRFNLAASRQSLEDDDLVRKAIELLTDYHNTMHQVYEERDWARKQHAAALSSNGQLNKRIGELIAERNAARANVVARIREAIEGAAA